MDITMHSELEWISKGHKFPQSRNNHSLKIDYLLKYLSNIMGVPMDVTAPLTNFFNMFAVIHTRG